MTNDSSPPRILLGLVASVFAVAMLIYGASYVAAAWRFAQAEPRYVEVAHGKAATVVELDALTRVLRASPMRADLNRAAYIQVLAAQSQGLKTAHSATRMFAARKDLHAGLGVSPSDSYAWTRLAIAEYRLGNTDRAAAALSMALQIAPAERKLTAMQLDLALMLWPGLDGAGRAAVERRLNEGRKWPELARVLEGNSAIALRAKIESLHTP